MPLTALILLALAPPLHVLVTYETAEVRAGSDVLARVLCTSVWGVDEARMTDAQRQARADVLRRIDSTWANETRKGRLRLALALIRAEDVEPQAHESQTSCRFLLPDEKVVRTEFFLSSPTGSHAVVVEDLESGQYLAVIYLGQPSQLPELFHQLFANGGDAEKDPAAREELLRRIREEVDRSAGKIRVVAEVNGQRDLLAAGATNDETGAALARMWDNLDGEPRERIERVLGILVLVRATLSEPQDFDTTAVHPYLVATALELKGVPLLEAPVGTRMVRTSNVREGVMDPQVPPEDLTKPYYGKRGWWAIDFSRSFPAQVRLLLRGDRP